MPLRLLTVVEVASILRLGRTSVYSLIASGSLPSLRVQNRLRVREEALDAWVASQQAGSGSESERADTDAASAASPRSGASGNLGMGGS